MKPEDIDKLFKDRLRNASPTPSANLWNRLQDRMEAEMPHQIQSKEEKKSFMWIYSSVAATLSLLLTVGIVFYNVKSTPEVSNSLVIQDKTVLQETPVYNAPATEAIAQAEATADQVKNNSEKISEPQATEDSPPASSIIEKVDKPAITVKAVQQQKTASATVAAQPKADVQQAIAGNTSVSERKTEAITERPINKPAQSSALVANADMNASPVEIIIKRSAAPAAVTMQTEEDEPNGLERKAKLAKNIFKQARNLANGEQVELADLGIRADRLALETQIGKQKISKVINL